MVGMDDGSFVPITVGEAVVRSFGPLAETRGGRLTEVWGDQINLPGEDISCAQEYAVEIFNTVSPFQEQEEKEYATSKGVLVSAGNLDHKRDVKQREKPTINEIQGTARTIGAYRVADLSLGFNSYRWEFLTELLRMYAPELNRREGFFNIDSELWTPLTSATAGEYADFMWQKKITPYQKQLDQNEIDRSRFDELTSRREENDVKHLARILWRRIHGMRLSFQEKQKERNDKIEKVEDRKCYRIVDGQGHGVIGRTDYGFLDKTTDWWDYGKMDITINRVHLFSLEACFIILNFIQWVILTKKMVKL